EIDVLDVIFNNRRSVLNYVVQAEGFGGIPFVLDASNNVRPGIDRTNVESARSREYADTFDHGLSLFGRLPYARDFLLIIVRCWPSHAQITARTRLRTC